MPLPPTSAHRAHSSMVGVDLPVRAAGLLLKKELDFFGATLEAPETPFLAIMGGKKVSDKIKVIDNLLDQVSLMVIGGGMAYTFMSVKEGMSIGKSIFDPDGAETVPALLEKAAANGVEIVLPVDFRCATEFSPDAEVIIRSAADGIPDNEEGLDIGPASEELFAATIATAKTVIWNGPMGVFEFEAFASGTRSTLEACAAAAEAGSTVVLGGGETAACGFKWGYQERVSHISTGGGASLELMEGKVLPGVAYLSEKDAEATA